MCLATCLRAAALTIFSTGGKFRPVSNFTELHALTLAARSYALLHDLINAFHSDLTARLFKLCHVSK